MFISDDSQFLTGGVGIGNSEVCGIGTINEKRSGYITGGAFLPALHLEGPEEAIA